MKQIAIVVGAAALVIAGAVHSGPTDPSKFDATRYEAQKALYDFNFEQPEDVKGAFGYVRNHLRAIKEFGDERNSHIVIVAHGNELHALSRLNRAAYPEIYDELKTLAQSGVKIQICRNAAAARGYKPGDFYDVTTVVPSAVTDIAKWQNQGYSYMFAGVYPRLTREEVVRQHPELQR